VIGRGLKVEAAWRGFWIQTLILAIVPALAALARAQAPQPPAHQWLGKRVVQRHNNFPLRVDGQAVLRSGTEVHIYRVERADGDKLWLVGEGDGPSGWASADQFICIEEALAYVTDRIRAHPDDVFFYVVRAALLRDRNDIDGAIADWNKIVQLEPDDANSYIGRGNLWLGKKAWDKAIADYSQAIRLDPRDAESYYSRARVWQQKGDAARAKADYVAGVALDPQYALPRVEQEASPNEIADRKKALDDFLLAVPLERATATTSPQSAAHKVKEQGVVPASFNPLPAPQGDVEHPTPDPGGHSPLPIAGAQPALSRDTFGVFEPQTAQEFIARAVDWLRIKQVDKAIADCNRAIDLGSHDPRARVLRGMAWFDKKEYDKAMADETEAIRLDPQNAFAYYARGSVWSMKKEYKNALADLGESSRLDPENPASANGLAWIWATCPDARYRNGKKSVESAIKACELTEWNEPGVLDTLAAAFAELGDFVSAVKWQFKAEEIETDLKNKVEFRSRLKLYDEKKPYRDTSQ